MKRILIIDVETSDLDPEKDHVVEVGCVLWDIAHATGVASLALVVPNVTNECAAINGIPESLLGSLPSCQWWSWYDAVTDLAQHADAYLAHNAAFDKSFCAERIPTRPWICSMDDVTWPVASHSKSLTAIALAHGVPVISAHRALTDCDTLERLLENCAMRGHDVGAMLAEGLRRALLPKFRYVADEPYARNPDLKEAGFRWDADAREWYRNMAEEDAENIVGIRMLRGEQLS